MLFLFSRTGAAYCPGARSTSLTYGARTPYTVLGYGSAMTTATYQEAVAAALDEAGDYQLAG